MNAVRERLFEHRFVQEQSIDKSISYDDFVNHFPKNEPVLIDGVSDAWPARAWTPAVLRERWGQAPLKLKTGERMTVAEYVDLISNPSDELPYAFSIALRNIDPEMLKDLEPVPGFTVSNWVKGPALLRKMDLLKHGHFELLFGAAGSTFPSFHFDVFSQHAFIFQLYGEKEVLFLSPEDGNRLEKDVYNKLLLNPAEAHDPESLGQFDGMPVYRAKLSPGRSLFVPAQWWHAVTNPTDSIAVTISTVDRFNWRRYVTDIKADSPKEHRLKYATKVLLMELWGLYCRVARR